MRAITRFPPRKYLPYLMPLLGLFGCSASQPPVKPTAPRSPVPAAVIKLTPPPTPVAREPKLSPVLLGIDTLEAEGFSAIKGKRIGLLTHTAGVNRRGVSTVEVLRRAPGVRLVALFGVEHGINNEFAAGDKYNNYTDKRTGLPVRSLYDGKSRKPTPAQLKDLDALVVDLQDIGTRSYTFISAMRLALEACFENGKEIIVLDRPNPLGGLKVDGPPMDAQLVVNNYVGAFHVPYVHGLTMGELARIASQDMRMPEATRTRGRLTVIPMRGWTRSMRWPETGLTWIPTSPKMPDFSAVQGYPMVGLGCESPSAFWHGVGEQYPFRGLAHRTAKLEVYERELKALKIPGIQFRRISVPNAKTGQPAQGLFVEITDWDDWRPTELNFWLMKLSCKLDPKNPFAAAKLDNKSMFVKLLGSSAFVNDLAVKGKDVDVAAWLRLWRERSQSFQQNSKKYWLYN